jgi:FMN-dependent NADH-azoreductase
VTLLRIDSSSRDRSVSRQLTPRFVEVWRAAHPAGRIIERDLATTTLPPITDDWLATYGDPALITLAQQSYLLTSDELIGELFAAAVIVIGAPMYNLSISAQLKGWIDHVVRKGKTVAYTADGPKGLLAGRHAIIITARGGSYGGTPRAGTDYQEPYLREIFRFIGLADVTFVHAENQAKGALAADAQAAVRERLVELVADLSKEVALYGATEVH